MRRMLPFLVVLLLVSPRVRGEDWSGFRGPTGDGQSKANGLPTEWGPTKNIAWKQAIPGLGWSSPVVVAGKVYLTTADEAAGGNRSLRALCLDAKSGKIVWNVEVFRQTGKGA